MYVCMYIYTYIYIYNQVYIHIYIYTHTHMYISTKHRAERGRKLLRRTNAPHIYMKYSSDRRRNEGLTHRI